jgi:hypothetical protein
MIYVLIFTALTYKGGVHTATVEFNSKAACQLAASEISKQVASSDPTPDWRVRNPIIMCAAKGVTP